jgi:two-component system chemotaxis sensor kinase CheA
MDDDDLGFDFQPMTISLDAQAADAAVLDDNVWTVSIQPKSDLYRKANETALLLRELSRLGPIQATLDDSALPALEFLDAEAAYVTWSVRVETEQGEEAIREVFEFVDGDCDLEITRARPRGRRAGDPAGRRRSRARGRPRSPSPELAVIETPVEALVSVAPVVEVAPPAARSSLRPRCRPRCPPRRRSPPTLRPPSPLRSTSLVPASRLSASIPSGSTT